MISLRKLRLTFTPKWVISKFPQNQLCSSESPLKPPLLFHIAQKLRFYGVKKPVLSVSVTTIKHAQAALLEYLHSTRSLHFLDADNMCKNSPCFLEGLLKKVGKDDDIRRSITRYLRYHPINEFEPFFESIGLKPSEYASLLPRDMMFLSDDELMLGNYHTLCSYGIPRTKVGNIFKEAPEVFRYGHGVLLSKLKAYEELGLRKPTLMKVFVSSPYLLIGDTNSDVFKVTEKLNHFGKDIDWVERHLLDGASYNWGHMLELLHLIGKIFSEEQLAEIISQHHSLLFEDSGGRTFSLIALLLKIGLSMNQISLIFLQFPPMQVGKFLSNLRHCYLFLSEISMEAAEIGKIFRSHSLLLGSFTIKRTSSLLSKLHAGKRRLCKILQDNPQEMKNWILGKRIRPLPISQEQLESQMQKTKFLVSMGYEENSQKMKKALKLYRGKGGELQERFDCIVKAGIKCEDVRRMARVSPQILNQTTDVIKWKIHYLVNELGYPISTLLSFPSYLSYTTPRVKLRLSMYNWLKDQGAVNPRLALSSIVACTEKTFLNQFVNYHPSGPQVWEDLKEKIYSEN